MPDHAISLPPSYCKCLLVAATRAWSEVRQTYGIFRLDEGVVHCDNVDVVMLDAK